MDPPADPVLVPRDLPGDARTAIPQGVRSVPRDPPDAAQTAPPQVDRSVLRDPPGDSRAAPPPAGRSVPSRGIHLPAQGTPKNQARGQSTRHMVDTIWTRHWPRAYWVARQPFEAHSSTQPRSKLTLRRRPPTARQGQAPAVESLQLRARRQHSIGPPLPVSTVHPTPLRGHSTGRQPRFARRPSQPPMQGTARPCCLLR